LNVQGYVQMAKVGKDQESLSIIMQDLPLPGTIGRICPHPCEDPAAAWKWTRPSPFGISSALWPMSAGIENGAAGGGAAR
jgi:hypothetical protein